MNVHTPEQQDQPLVGLLGHEPSAVEFAPPLKGVSTRAFLAFLAIGLTIPLLGFSGYLIWREARAERARYIAELAQTANQLSVVLDREFRFLVTLLEGMASSPAMQGDDFATFHEQARSLRGLPGVNISVRTAAGKMLLNARVGYGAPEVDITTVLDHDAVLLSGKHPVMSNVFAGITRGGYSFSAAIPVLRNGDVAYIVQANLSTSHFSELMREFRLSNDVEAFMLDRNNVFVALAGNRAALTGKKYGYSAQPPEKDGIFRGVDFDGEAIVGVITSSVATGWRVGVTAKESTVAAPTNRAMRDLAALGAVCTSIGLMFAFAIGRRIHNSRTNRRSRLSMAARAVFSGMEI